MGHRLPGFLHGVEVGHVGHGAAGVEVGEDHLLMVTREDVGRLGHEVDATEHDVGGVVLVGGLPGEAEGVSPGVGPTHHLVALVVVTEDEQTWAERGLGRADPRLEILWRGHGVQVRERSLEPKHMD